MEKVICKKRHKKDDWNIIEKGKEAIMRFSNKWEEVYVVYVNINNNAEIYFYEEKDFNIFYKTLKQVRKEKLEKLNKI